MKKNQLWSVLPSLLLSAALLGSCAKNDGNGNNGTGSDGSGTDGSVITDDSTVTVAPVDTTEHRYAFVSQDGDSYTYRCDDCGESQTVTVACSAGTAGCVTVQNNTITLAGMTEDSTYTLSGAFYGNIVVEGTEDCEIELELNGFTLTSPTECPLTVSGADQVTISAKKGTDNYLNDIREAVTDENAVSAAVWADCDLSLQGKGNLYVSSVANNGIHTKDDLKVKNLYLQVECEDNALKGNDSVTVESGTLVLIARTGDGIKTTNSDLSKKGKQRGTVAITGGDIRIYAACDGIDAAYDVTVDESGATVNLTIFTDQYSKYSKEVTANSESTLYLRTNTDTYRYSLYFYQDGGGVWCNTGSAKTSGNYRYYTVEKPSGYTKLKLYLYTADQEPGQSENYYYVWDDITVSDSYDTLAVSVGKSLKLSWTNYTTTQPGGGFPGGGMNDGNQDKGDHSTKGLKAANAITVSAGTVTVESYDDCIHANNGTTLENGEAATGNVTVSGGSLTLSSNDDAVHADGEVTVSGGTVNILKSYEGLEGTVVTVSGGDISVVSSDDGINGTGTSGTGIVISGGTVYVLAGGDGVDSNSRDSYCGILFSGGRSVIISTGRADSSIDTEQGYRYTGGYVVAIGLAGGMSQESTHCSPSLTSIGTSKNVTLSAGSYLTVDGVATVQAPAAMNALVICLGKTDASITTGSSGSGTVSWKV